MSKDIDIPLVYHPATVLTLDDDSIFLDSMRGILDINTPYIAEQDPDLAFQYLLKNTYQLDSLPSLVTDVSFDHDEGLESIEHFMVDFGKLSAALDTPDRFKKVMVAFIDQNMPKISGLEFCRKVREANLKVKLVLLTGTMGLEGVVSAFNEGVIDAYVSKERDDLDKIINFYSTVEAWKQFVDLGAHLLGSILHTIEPLHNEKFLNFFKEVWRDHEAGEFYLMDSSCSFLFFNHNGDATALLVRDAEDFKEVLEFAENENAPDVVLQGIREHKLFPITQHKNGYLQLKGNEWEAAMQEMKPMPGTDKYYILVDRDDVKSFSFDRYFQEIWLKKT